MENPGITPQEGAEEVYKRILSTPVSAPEYGERTYAMHPDALRELREARAWQAAQDAPR